MKTIVMILLILCSDALALRIVIVGEKLPKTGKEVQESRKKEEEVDCDYNNDGVVNLYDYAIFASKWLERENEEREEE